ncbi:uncharacterized protein [Typha latifolia]|uniref:uncharacterized protein isoform X1 n=1 Tax=Typha latifolia TaxID=4733 RepID=UPI003C2D2454
MEQLVNFIIRPPRADYSPKDDLLDQEFMIKGRWFQRKDLEVINCRGKKLKCSHYLPLIIPEGKALPCVICCHGNSGCRADASEAAIILLPSNITVFTLDFSGSGLSEGEHVTLGWNEKDDLSAVVNHLRTDGNISCIGLWGRSMGAVTSLMYGAEDPSIAGMVLDSPFSNLVELMMELVDTYKYPLPKFTVKLAIQHMRRIIKKKANFDIMDLDTIQVAKRCFVPVLLGHAFDDDFIRPHHSDRIYESYVGDKNIIKFDGDHNSPRPHFYFDSITIFFHNVLNPPNDVCDDHYFDQGHWGFIHDTEFRNHSSIGPPLVNVQSTTEDAIAELRARRLMSRTVVPSGTSTLEKRDSVEEPDKGCDAGPSSSRLCSKLPNGQPLSPLTPSAEDDDYVEYSFSSLPEIPFSVDDEERMIMEAIIESLKDLEVRHTQGPQSNVCDATSQSLDTTKDCPVGSKEPQETAESCLSESTNNNDSNVDTTVSSQESSNNEADGMNNTAIRDALSSKDCSSSEYSSLAKDGDTSSSSCKEAAMSGGTLKDAEVSGGTSKDAEVSNGTRATLVVQKTSSSHILDGLTQRWGLNFFKSNR